MVVLLYYVGHFAGLLWSIFRKHTLEDSEEALNRL